MSIVEENPAEECFLCGAGGYLERHHIFGGPNRKWSEKYGLTVHLCWKDHQDPRDGVHFNLKKRRYLQKIGQREFEKRYSRESFLRIFGRNYLEEECEGRTDQRVGEFSGGVQ